MLGINWKYPKAPAHDPYKLLWSTFLVSINFKKINNEWKILSFYQSPPRPSEAPPIKINGEHIDKSIEQKKIMEERIMKEKQEKSKENISKLINGYMKKMNVQFVEIMWLNWYKFFYIYIIYVT